jgi:excisionase family DNA binding protein
MTTDGGEWLTVQEAAKLSGYNPDYIRELIRQGKIKAQKFSIVWMVSRDSFSEYMQKAQSMGEKRGPKTEYRS